MMPLLPDHSCNKELKTCMPGETEPRTAISLYRYYPVPNPEAFCDGFYCRLQEWNLVGLIYVAHKGIYAQITALKCHFEALKQALNRYAWMSFGGLLPWVMMEKVFYTHPYREFIGETQYCFHSCF